MVEKGPADYDILEAERDVLRAMCQGTPERALLSDGLEILSDYSFMDPTHQLVFDTLRELRAGNPQLIRETLPVRLNNKGFPDMDLETFFTPHRLTADEAVARMRTIRKAAAGKDDRMRPHASGTAKPATFASHPTHSGPQGRARMRGSS